jgi:acetyl esterase/lipase
MQLWSDEIEGMRPEARTVVSAALSAIAEAFTGQGEPPADLHERALFSREAFARTLPPAEPTAVEVELAGVPCRVFRPEGPAKAVFVHFHGGGMILGSAQMNDPGNRAMADRHQVAVVSVEYRLAPEHPYPAGPDDGVAVVRWLLENGVAELGTDRLLVGGESAGGYMAAAVMLRMRDIPGALDRLLGANLVFGVMDWGRSPSQRGIRATDGPDMLTPEGIVSFCDCYLPGLTDDERRAPEISPAFADLRDLPPAMFSVGTADHLLDDTLFMAGRYAAAGNETELFVAPDMPHGFQAFQCGISTEWARTFDAWMAARLA